MPYIIEVVQAGRTVEVMKYYSSRYGKKGIKRGERKALTKEEQIKVNKRAAEKKLRRLINENFQEGDTHLVLDYRKERRPAGRKQMREDADDFLREMRKLYKRHGIPFKYIHVMEIAGAVKVYGRKGKIEALYPCTIEGITIDDAGVLRSTKKHKVLVDFKVPGTGMNESAFYEDLLIFKGFTMDGINTEAVRTIVKSTIDVQIKAQNYLNTLFDNGLTNKMVIQLTSDIRDEKELRKIQEKFGKLYSKGKRIFTVPAGFNVQPVNLSLADAQYEQIRRMSISQIAALFGIKMYQLNDLKDTNNNSLEQQQLSFLVDTLLILYESIEQEVTWGCLTKDDRAQGYKAKHNTNVILRSSPETQQKILCAYVAGGIIKPNEARLELGRETTEDGDDLIVNAGVLKLKDLGKDTKGNAGE